MGDYANYNGESIKIGTCESMYYLRWDQADLVTAEPGSVDPIKDKDGIRFRFPFPDEDNVEPGAFMGDYDRSITLYGLTVPEGVNHYSVQFKDTQNKGFLVSMPCPESGAEQPFKIHRNGYQGAVGITQQRWWEGKLVTVAQCGGCGGAWRYPDLESVEPVITALMEKAIRDESAFYMSMARRVLAGYTILPANDNGEDLQQWLQKQ